MEFTRPKSYRVWAMLFFGTVMMIYAAWTFMYWPNCAKLPAFTDRIACHLRSTISAGPAPVVASLFFLGAFACVAVTGTGLVHELLDRARTRWYPHQA